MSNKPGTMVSMTRRKPSGKVGVFSETGFEPAPAWITRDVQQGPNSESRAERLHLYADDSGQLADLIRCKGRAERRALRERNRVADTQPRAGVLVTQRRDAESCRGLDVCLQRADEIAYRPRRAGRNTANTSDVPDTVLQQGFRPLGVELVLIAQLVTEDAAELRQLLLDGHPP